MMMMVEILIHSADGLTLIAYISLLFMTIVSSLVYFTEQGTWFKPGEDVPLDDDSWGNVFAEGQFLRPDVSGSGQILSPFGTTQRPRVVFKEKHEPFQ